MGNKPEYKYTHINTFSYMLNNRYVDIFIFKYTKLLKIKSFWKSRCWCFFKAVCLSRFIFIEEKKSWFQGKCHIGLFLVILAVPCKERQLLYKQNFQSVCNPEDWRWGSFYLILSILLAACLSSGQNLDVWMCGCIF